MAEELVVKAPASIANLGPGFDVVALALEEPVDVVKVSVRDGSGEVMVYNRGPYGGDLPTDAKANSAYYVAIRALELANIKADVIIDIYKGIKPSSGLGSSGATSAAVAYALNKLLKLNLSGWDLVELASYGELASAGVRHMDNVAASVMGGLVIVNQYTRRVIKLKPPNLNIVVVIEGSKPSTGIMRSILPKSYDRGDVVFNLANLAQLTYSVAVGDSEGFLEVLENDKIAMPYRISQYPHWPIVKEVLVNNGARGVTLSGAGPAIVGFFKDKPPVESIRGELARRGLKPLIISTRPSDVGVEEVKVYSSQ